MRFSDFRSFGLSDDDDGTGATADTVLNNNDNSNLMPAASDYAPGTTVSGSTVTLVATGPATTQCPGGTDANGDCLNAAGNVTTPVGTVATQSASGQSSSGNSGIASDISSILGTIKNVTSPTVKTAAPASSSALPIILFLGAAGAGLYFYFKSQKKKAA